jgi:hypothetical protein
MIADERNARINALGLEAKIYLNSNPNPVMSDGYSILIKN